MKYKIFDIHVHHGVFNKIDFSSSFLQTMCKKENIEGMLVSSLNAIETPNHIEGGKPLKGQNKAAQETFEICSKHKNWLPAFVCQVGHDSANEAEKELNKNKFSALKFHPYMLGINANDKKYDPFMELAKDFDIPAVFHAAPGTSDPAFIYSLAKRHPSVKTVLYHINLTGDLDYGLEVLLMAKKKKDANLYCDTSWVPKNYVLKAIDLLGMERVLFGTDLPLDGETHYSYYEPIIKAVEDKFGKSKCQKWLWDQNINFFET